MRLTPRSLIPLALLTLGGCQQISDQFHSEFSLAPTTPHPHSAIAATIDEQTLDGQFHSATLSRTGIGQDPDRSDASPEALKDDGDRAAAAEAFNQVAQASVGDGATWRNEKTADSGSIRVMRDGISPAGSKCRDFAMTAILQGDRIETIARECDDGAGGWIRVQ